MVQFDVPGRPIGKPRQTQRDKWAKRPAVLRYRAYADALRLAAPKGLPAEPFQLSVTFRIPMPATWPKRKRAEMDGQFHRQKPDVSNLLKSVEDALWSEDQQIAAACALKLWTAGPGLTSVTVI